MVEVDLNLRKMTVTLSLQRSHPEHPWRLAPPAEPTNLWSRTLPLALCTLWPGVTEMCLQVLSPTQEVPGSRTPHERLWCQGYLSHCQSV